jgi:hypothetical protein
MSQGKELVFVHAYYSIGFDSNVFTRKAGKSSFTQSAGASMDYTRQAGLIGVSASAGVTAGTFASLNSQNFVDPSASLSLRKSYGRTTGSLTISGGRQSQPDPDAGQRTQSWLYATVLDVRYPINDRYYITNSFEYSDRHYTTDTQLFSNLTTYGDSIFVNYIYTSKLDLNGGYSIRLSDTSRNSKAYDHSFTVGANGSILPKLSGSIRFGFQVRNSNSVVGRHENFGSFTSSTDLKWLYSRRLSFNGSITEDFSTSSTDISTDRLNLGLRMTYSLTAKIIGNFGVSYSPTRYLGVAGDGRRDELLTFDASLGIALNTHIRTSVSYSYMINTSNKSVFEFTRQTLGLTIAATY